MSKGVAGQELATAEAHVGGERPRPSHRTTRQSQHPTSPGPPTDLPPLAPPSRIQHLTVSEHKMRVSYLMATLTLHITTSTGGWTDLLKGDVLAQSAGRHSC